jgi:hypothetical protein
MPIEPLPISDAHCAPEDREIIDRVLGHDKLVYLIQIGPGPVKVGVARCPYRRLGDIQVACPYDVAILRITWGGADLEGYLHHRWREHRIRGEWFEPADEILRYASGDADLSLKFRRAAKIRMPGTNWRGRATAPTPGTTFRTRRRLMDAA